MWMVQYDSRADLSSDTRNAASTQVKDEKGVANPDWDRHESQFQAARDAASTLVSAVPDGPNGVRITLSGGPDQVGVSIAQLANPPKPKEAPTPV